MADRLVGLSCSASIAPISIHYASTDADDVKTEAQGLHLLFAPGCGRLRRELVAGFELAGFAPAIDRHDIKPGEPWEDRLGGLIAQSDTVVFVMTPAVVSVGSVFAREIEGVQCHLVVAIVPDRDGKDFVPSQVILDVTQNYTVASVNRMTLISCLEDHFARVQVFGTELALAKYCQKEWPSAEIDQAIAELKRGLN